jgi:hypothetical protein
MPERQDPAIAPDQIHRDGDQAQAQRLAERLDEAGRDEAECRRPSDSTVTPSVNSASSSDEDQHRGVGEKELDPFNGSSWSGQGFCNVHPACPRLIVMAQSPAARPLRAMMPLGRNWMKMMMKMIM